MTTTTLRYAIMTSAFVGSMFVSPPESKAIFHWCKGCGQPAAAYPVAPAYAPPVIAAPPPVVAQYAPCNSCAPACAPAVVNYAPQVSYRPVVVNTPVTTFQPVAGCGPCGQPVTSMRPVTTMVQTTQYVPYTSYRPVYSVGYAAAVAAPQVVQYAAPAPAPAPVAVQYAPQPPVQFAPQQQVQYAPQQQVPYPAQPPVQYQPAPTLAPAPALPSSPAPASPSPSDARPSYDPNNPPTTSPDIRMKPTPEDPQLQYKAAPAATIPSQQAATELDNRTAARPVSGAYRSYTAPTQVRTVTTANDGWRPSGR